MDTPTYRVLGDYFHAFCGRDASSSVAGTPFTTVVEVETVTEETYHAIVGASPHFAWNPTDAGRTVDFFRWSELRTDGLKVPNPVFSTGCFHDCVTSHSVSGVVYEAEAANAIWNVKTWRITGSVGGQSFDAVVPSGTLSNGVDPVDEEDRPNEGARGIYTTYLTWFGDGVSFALHISPFSRMSSGTATPDAFVPEIRFSINDTTGGGFLGAQSANAIQTEDELTEYSSLVTLFGKDLPTYAQTSSEGAPSAFITIDVEDWWTNELWASW